MTVGIGPTCMVSCLMVSMKKLFCAICCSRVIKRIFKIATELATHILNIVQ